jgi:hypothetical protein
MPVKRLCTALFAILCFSLVASTSSAQAYQLAEDWRFRVTPYYWLASLSGTIGYSSLSADLASNSGSWPGSATSAFVLDAEALYSEHFGILANFTTVSLNKSPSISLGSANLGINASIFDVCALYRLGEVGDRQNAASAALDLFAGGRIWDAKLDLSANLMGESGGISKTKAWIDPLVGARIVVGLGKHLEAVFRGGIGGFGVGSDLTWDASATLAVIFCENARLIVGYRALSLRDESGSTLGATLDATLHGPIIGLGISF